MMRYFFLFLIAFKPIVSVSQELTGSQLLDKAIGYHDPNNNWNSFKGNLGITMSTPDGKERVSSIILNLPEEYFQLTSKKGDVTLKQTLNKGECELMLNGSRTIS